MSRVVLAMSGGVDSSVAAYLLRDAGHDVIGLFMRHGHSEPSSCAMSTADAPTTLPVVSRRSGHQQGCCTAADAEDARRVAERLGIPFYALDFADEFGRIMDYFVDEYEAGRTPNPCVVCNNWLKFGRLFDYADSVGADYVATGHYATLSVEDDGPALNRGADSDKDQSYVLFGIERDLLPRMMFPTGGYQKADIRRLAHQYGLPVADKRDSQEICFVPDDDYAAFVRSRRSDQEHGGEIVTTDGRVVGRHAGIEQFTIGQRKGLGIALGEPHFVVRIEPAARRVVIGAREKLARRTLTAADCNWLSPPPTAPRECLAQIRYNSPAQPASVTVLTEARMHVEFADPVYGVAPGQAVVIYDGMRVLGGGWIE